MQVVLDRAATAVRNRPGAVLAVLVVVSVGFGWLATLVETVVDVEQYSPTDTDAAQAFSLVQEDLGGAERGVVVIVDAGDGGEVIDREGITAARTISEALAGDDQLSDYLAADSPVAPAVMSFALPIEVALESEGLELEVLDDDQFDLLVAAAYDAVDPALLAGLVSDEFDPAEPSARAGLVNVSLGAGLTVDERRGAAVRVQAVVDGIDVDGVELTAFNNSLLSEELDDRLSGQIPLLLGLAVLVIVVVLGLAFRRVSDVLITLASLALALVWTFGMIGLLGPRGLGITGEFTQIAIAVPVMLIGLGVDYSIHLIGRFREELENGTDRADAVSVPIRTVGRALVLVTATTMIGFLANIISPLPPIVDLAIFMAAGIACACVVVGLFVPAARLTLDRRVSWARGDSTVPLAGHRGVLPRVMGRASALAAAAPIPVLATSLVLVALGVAAGLRLDTEFSQEQFIPPDTDAAEILVRMDELFGGEAQERTFLVVEGDLAEPAVANAMFDSADRAAQVDQVVVIDGVAAVQSPVHLVQRMATMGVDGATMSDGGPGQEVRDQLAEAGWAGDRFSDDADMDLIWQIATDVAPDALGRLMNDGATVGLMTFDTRGGENELDDLIAGLSDAAEPLRDTAAVTATSLQLVVSETLDALVGAQLQKIAFSSIAAMVVLVAYFGLNHRRPMLGAVTMVPTLIAVPLVLGGMWLVGLSFNALTATVAAIAIGFGVDYGIHVSTGSSKSANVRTTLPPRSRRRSPTPVPHLWRRQLPREEPSPCCGSSVTWNRFDSSAQ